MKFFELSPLLLVDHSKKWLRLLDVPLLEDVDPRDVRCCRDDEGAERRDERHDNLHLIFSISNFFLSCFFGLWQVGTAVSGTYVFMMFPHLGHRHFSCSCRGSSFSMTANLTTPL